MAIISMSELKSMYKATHPMRHWFDTDTMRVFGTKLSVSVQVTPKNYVFVSGEDQFDSSLPKRYTIRVFSRPDLFISSYGEFLQYSTRAKAQTAMLKAIKEGVL